LQFPHRDNPRLRGCPLRARPTDTRETSTNERVLSKPVAEPMHVRPVSLNSQKRCSAAAGRKREGHAPVTVVRHECAPG
jgi:hypothetical protein